MQVEIEVFSLEFLESWIFKEISINSKTMVQITFKRHRKKVAPFGYLVQELNRGYDSRS